MPLWCFGCSHRSHGNQGSLETVWGICSRRRADITTSLCKHTVWWRYEILNSVQCWVRLLCVCVQFGMDIFYFHNLIVPFLGNLGCLYLGKMSIRKSSAIYPPGWRVGSVVRALDWRSKGWGFESHQEHKKMFEFFWVNKVVLTLSVCPTPLCIRTHTKDHICTLKIL